MMMKIPILPADTAFVTCRESDVKCGRGKECFQHPGNVLLRVRVAARLQEYKNNQTNTAIKAAIVNSVVSAFYAEGARFLKRDQSAKLWYDGGIKAGRERVGSAFRDASKPNKVKCMEVPTAHFNNNDQYGSLFETLPTMNAMRAEAECTIRTPSPVMPVRRCSMEELQMVGATGHNPIPPQLHDAYCHNNLLSPASSFDRCIDSVSSTLPSQPSVWGNADSFDYRGPDSNSTDHCLQKATYVWHDIDSEGLKGCSMLMDDVDIIGQDVSLTQEDKEFLTSVWGHADSFDYRGPDSNSTDHCLQKATYVWHDIDSKGLKGCSMLMDDVDIIGQDVSLTQEGKEFLASLNW